jgi:hypothetical protein
MNTFPAAVVADHAGTNTTYSTTGVVEHRCPHNLDFSTGVPPIGDIPKWTGPYHSIREIPCHGVTVERELADYELLHELAVAFTWMAVGVTVWVTVLPAGVV